MNKYLEIYDIGFCEGIKDAYFDSIKNKKRKFMKISDKELKSKLYDIGYIEGYDKFVNIIENHLYFENKI